VPPAEVEAFEPRLPFARDGEAPTFRPRSALGEIDRARLGRQLGDERYWSLMGSSPFLATFAYKGAVSSSGLVVPNFLTGADQHTSSVASVWDDEGRLVGDLPHMTHISDVAGASDAPLVAFATSTYPPGGQTHPFGVWLFNTRALRFYADRVCTDGVADGVAFTPSGKYLAARCSQLDKSRDFPTAVKPRVMVWDLRGHEIKLVGSAALPDEDWDWRPREASLTGGAAGLVLSDDARHVAIVTKKHMLVLRTADGKRLQQLRDSIPVHVDEDFALVRSGPGFDQLERIRLRDGRHEVIAEKVTAAAQRGGTFYWATGAKVSGEDRGRAIGPVDLAAAGVTRGGDPEHAPGGLVVEALLPRRDGSLLARIQYGPVVPLRGDLSPLPRKPKLPGHASALAWRDDGAIQVTSIDRGFTWTPGSETLVRQEDKLRTHFEEPGPEWSFFECDNMPRRSEDQNCATLLPYIVGICSQSLESHGLAAGNLIENPDAPGPPEAKVFSAHFNGKLKVSSWLVPGGFRGCAVAPDAESLALGFGDGGIAAYRHTGERLWKNDTVHAIDVLAYAHGAVIASIGEGKLAWLDARTGALRRQWKAHLVDGCMLAAVHPSGTRVATTSCDETIRIWDLTP
jgi:hypothetical protein